MSASSLQYSHHLLRIATAILFGIHGWYRFLYGNPDDFGAWLTSQGLPLGTAIAWSVTIFEMLGSLLLLANRFVVWCCLGEFIIVACGIALVHAPEGWFVVGAGRNGVEYSVLLLACLTAIALPQLKPERWLPGAAR